MRLGLLSYFNVRGEGFSDLFQGSPLLLQSSWVRELECSAVFFIGIRWQMNKVPCGSISVPTQGFSLWEYAAFYHSSSGRMSKASVCDGGKPA